VNRYLVLALALLCFPLPLAAQERPDAPAAPLLALAQRHAALAASQRWFVKAETAQQRVPGQPPRTLGLPMPRPLLSGSATGYVENAIIGSQIRLRLDFGFGSNAPDRAEFFYAKCGCFRELGTDPDAPGPSPALDGRDPMTTRFIETSLDFTDFYVDAEYAPHPRFSVFGQLPVRSISPEVNADASGISDLRAGMKLGLVATAEDALTFQFRTYFPSGEARDGLGTDHSSLEFTLLYHRRMADRASFGAEIGAWHPVDGSSALGATSADDDFAGDVLRWGLGLGYDVVSGSTVQFAPVVEVVGWRVLGGFVTGTTDGTLSTGSVVSAEDTNIVNLKLGGRVTSGRNSFYVGYGFPLSDDEWYDEIVRIEYRFAF
jgi:hypothetical protein